VDRRELKGKVKCISAVYVEEPSQAAHILPDIKELTLEKTLMNAENVQKPSIRTQSLQSIRKSTQGRGHISAMDVGMNCELLKGEFTIYSAPKNSWRKEIL
jgi:hypothetical protein